MKSNVITATVVVVIVLAGCVFGYSQNEGVSSEVGSDKNNEVTVESEKAMSDTVTTDNDSNSLSTTDAAEEDEKTKIFVPDFEISLLNGEADGNLTDLYGKPILLNFWATWCGPCVMEMPDIEKVHNYYGEEVIVLAVNIGEKQSVVQDFIDKNGYSFPILLDPDSKIARMYGIQSIPQSFILDSTGAISAYIPFSADEDIFKNSIEQILNGESQ